MSAFAGTSRAGESRILPWDENLPAFYAIRFSGSFEGNHGNDPPAFTPVVNNRRPQAPLRKAGAYSAALSLLCAEIAVQGDRVSAVRFHAGRGERSWHGILQAAARFSSQWIATWLQTQARAARNIRLHCDRSNEFCKSFLNPRTVYLYQARSAVSFKGGVTSICQMLLAKRGSPVRRLTRDYTCAKADRRPEQVIEEKPRAQ